MINQIEEAWEKYVEEEQPRQFNEPREYVYASARRKCLRRMVLEARHPNAFTAWDTETKAKFVRGKEREMDLRRALSRIGQLCEPKFDFTAQQKSVHIYNKQGNLIISGKIDGMITVNGSQWPVEIKAWSQHLTDKIENFYDIYESPWTWGGAHQLLAYLYAENQPYGLLVLDRPGLPRLIEVNLEENLEQMEGFLRDGEVTHQHLRKGTLPDYINDREECQRCPAYLSLCTPPAFAQKGEEPLVFPSAELESLLDERNSIEVPGKRFEVLDHDLKKHFRGVENGVCGKWSIQGKWQKNTTYSVPIEIKKQYEVVDEQGKFFLKFIKNK